MASPITWRTFPAAWANMTCHECGAEIPEGQPHVIRSYGRRYARTWCCTCKARVETATDRA